MQRAIDIIKTERIKSEATIRLISGNIETYRTKLFELKEHLKAETQNLEQLIDAENVLTGQVPMPK